MTPRRSPAIVGPGSIEAFGGAGPECITALVDLVRRRLHDLDLERARLGARVDRLERVTRGHVDVSAPAEFAAANIIEAVGPDGATRLASALVLGAVDVRGVVA